MISPQRTALPAAVTAAVLALASILPAHAAQENPQENMNPSKGSVVSVETDELKTVVEDPKLPSAPPKTGDKNPGATMGQRMKTMRQTTNLSEDSEKALEKVEKSELGGSGKPAGAPSDSPSSTTTPAPATGATAPAKGAAAGHDVKQVGPAGSMSMVLQANTWIPAGIPGMDVSGWQPAVNWSAEYSMGARFAYVKATEGTGYVSPSWASQYTGAYNVGMIRGSYHFALPSLSSGAAQADYFVNNGGGWSADGKTLPGLLDIEYNPYSTLGNTCYNMSASQMNTWIKSFSDRYKARTGRLPVIYTTADWWATCTGNTSQFNDHPLHLASYYVAAPQWYPNGWSTYDIWQYSSEGPFSGDSNVYRGSMTQLRSLATSRTYKPIGGRAPAGTTRPGSYGVSGGIGSIYRATGGAGVWGTPIMNEAAAAYGGRYQEFVRNGVKSTAYWHPSSGAHIFRNSSAIGKKFIATGRERGFGFPSIQERSIAGGAYQSFTTPTGRTTKVMWSGGPYAYGIKEYGAIGRLWASRGHERGYGFPVTDEYRVGDQVHQRFSKGYTLKWSSTTNHTWVTR